MTAHADAVRSALLLLRHRAGERTAFAELVGLWERPLLYYLRRLLPAEEDAWDALQETWVRAVREQHRLRDERAFPAWLYTIARRVASRARLRAHPGEPLPGDEEPGALPAADPAPDLSGFDALDIHRALAALSLAHREALTLHFLEGFSVTEIGAITGAADGTVKSRLFHARHALRARLQGGQVMNESRMRDALLATEMPSPELERRYRERLLAMTERRLTPAKRTALVILLLVMLGVAAWFVRMLVTYPAGSRVDGWISLPVGLILLALLAAYAISALRRGTEDLHQDGLRGMQLVGLCALVMLVLMMWQAYHQADPARGNHKILVGLVVWTVGALPVGMAHFVKQSELRVRTDLLRLELALAQRNEAGR